MNLYNKTVICRHVKIFFLFLFLVQGVLFSYHSQAAIVQGEFGGTNVIDIIDGDFTLVNATYPGWYDIANDIASSQSWTAHFVIDSSLTPNIFGNYSSSAPPSSFTIEFLTQSNELITFSSSQINFDPNSGFFVTGTNQASNPFGFASNASIGLELFAEPAFSGPEIPESVNLINPQGFAYVSINELGVSYWLDLTPEYLTMTTISAVPVPPSVLLFSSAIFSFGFFSKRCRIRR